MNSFENINIPWTGWKIVKELGEGGYGKVYEIERTQHGITENDALKIIRIPKDRRQYDEVAYRLTSEDEESIRAVFSDQKDKVINEVRAMQQLKATDNIVGIKDWTVSKLDDGYSWEICIRMDVLTPLVKYVKKNKELEEEEVIKLGEDICRALEQCEKENIVHRDIKPDNIMVSENGKFMLGDFGIARYLEDDTTMTGVGSKPYMAPEVANFRKAGKTVDIYSLGLVLYDMLNNCRPPFINAKGKYSALEKENAIQRRMKGEELPEPANGSDELKKIVLKACDPDPSKRFRTAAAMLKALEKLKAKGYGEKEKADKTEASENTQKEEPGVGRPAVTALFCSNCGNKLPGNAKFCSRCGNRMLGADEQRSRDLSTVVDEPHKKELSDVEEPKHEDTAFEEPAAATTEKKASDALSLEELEKDLFGEIRTEETEAEEQKKIDKFYALKRKNEEFHRLLDEEYDKLKGESSDESESGGGTIPDKTGAVPEAGVEKAAPSAEIVRFKYITIVISAVIVLLAATGMLIRYRDSVKAAEIARSALPGDWEYQCTEGDDDYYYDDDMLDSCIHFAEDGNVIIHVDNCTCKGKWELRGELRWKSIFDIKITDYTIDGQSDAMDQIIENLKLYYSSPGDVIKCDVRDGEHSALHWYEKEPEAAAEKSDETETASGQADSIYEAGKEYKLKDDMIVREEPSTDSAVRNASELAEEDRDKAAEGEDAVIAKGSTVKCLEVSGDWIRIPSGWICGNEKGRYHIVAAEVADRLEEQRNRFYSKIGVDPETTAKLTGIYATDDENTESVEFFEDGDCAVLFSSPAVPVTDEEGYTNGSYAVKGDKVYLNYGGSVYAEAYEISGKTLIKLSEEIDLMQ